MAARLAPFFAPTRRAERNERRSPISDCQNTGSSMAGFATRTLMEARIISILSRAIMYIGPDRRGNSCMVTRRSCPEIPEQFELAQVRAPVTKLLLILLLDTDAVKKDTGPHSSNA